MREYADPLEPGKRLPFFEKREIEQIVLDAMRGAGMDPGKPGLFMAEILLQEHFGLAHKFVPMPEGRWGEAAFGPRGLASVGINPTSRTGVLCEHRSRHFATSSRKGRHYRTVEFELFGGE